MILLENTEAVMRRGLCKSLAAEGRKGRGRD